MIAVCELFDNLPLGGDYKTLPNIPVRQCHFKISVFQKKSVFFAGITVVTRGIFGRSRHAVLDTDSYSDADRAIPELTDHNNKSRGVFYEYIQSLKGTVTQ
jgi:hypothetical protein